MPITRVWECPQPGTAVSERVPAIFDSHVATMTEQMGAMKESLKSLEKADTNLIKNIDRVLSEIGSLRTDFFAEAKRVEETFAARSNDLERRLVSIEQKLLVDEAERIGRVKAFKLVVSLGSAAAAVIGWAVGHFLRLP